MTVHPAWKVRWDVLCPCYLSSLAPGTNDHNVLQLFLQYFMDNVPRQI